MQCSYQYVIMSHDRSQEMREGESDLGCREVRTVSLRRLSRNLRISRSHHCPVATPPHPPVYPEWSKPVPLLAARGECWPQEARGSVERGS